MVRLVLSRVFRHAFRRPAELHARDNRVYTALIDHLHSEVGSVMGGVIGGMVLAWFCHQADPNGNFLTLMALMGVIGSIRIFCLCYYRQKHRGFARSYRVTRLHELIYGIGAVSFAGLFGLLTIMVFSDPETEQLRALILASAVGYAGGIAGRNAGRPVIAVSQVTASCLPLAVFLIFNPSIIHLSIAVMLMIYMVTLWKIVRVLNEIVSRAFKTERDVGEINERLDTAITNMMSGLCMIDEEGSIKVLNERFCSLLDLPNKGFLRLHEILLSALPRGTLRHAEISEIQSALRDMRNLVLKFVTDRGIVLVLKATAIPTGGHLLTIEDVTEQTRAAADIERMAKFDSLTGLANRATILSTITRGMAASGEMRGVSLLLLDLDKFKEINDTLGHHCGDQLLVKIGERLKTLVPPGHCIGRLGGDEFVVVLQGVQHHEAENLAAKIVKAIAKPVKVARRFCQTTVSIGVAHGPDHGADAVELIKAADIALYAQKGKGRNGFDRFDADMAQQLARRRQLEIDLADALKDGKIELAFQPIVSAATREIVAFEALARWNHARFGEVPPSVFIPIAESTGLIMDLGRHVLTAACQEAMNWPEHIGVSVNVSPLQFKNREMLFTDIWLALSASGLAAKRLDLEVTESVLIDDAEGMLRLIDALRNMEISVSLDDFGTGYSSLAYVQNYRFDKIKLDRAFAREIETDRTSRATISALANIAAATGSTLLLEGVESEPQARIATAHGVNEMQGFLFSRPIPASQIPGIIHSRFNEKRVA